ncbi:MAG: hypothetical protein HC911_10430 [Chloroflexaceae bacterium]|nr:hypothetical protein [Chloroflexaceae bacterium]
MANIVEFVRVLWAIVWNAMALNPRLAQEVYQYPQAFWYILTIVFISGISLLIGQSVILFVNRVSPQRFLLSLVMSGFMQIVSIILWATVVFLAGDILFSARPRFVDVLNIVMLSTAPFVFGFLVLIPYAGMFVYRLLNAWSFIIAVGAIRFTYNVGWGNALLAVGLGWIFAYLLTITVGRPVIALRNRIARQVVGTSLDARPKEILNALMQQAGTPSDPADSNKKGGSER